jgi:hypothetical protein
MSAATACPSPAVISPREAEGGAGAGAAEPAWAASLASAAASGCCGATNTPGLDPGTGLRAGSVDPGRAAARAKPWPCPCPCRRPGPMPGVPISSPPPPDDDDSDAPYEADEKACWLSSAGMGASLLPAIMSSRIVCAAAMASAVLCSRSLTRHSTSAARAATVEDGVDGGWMRPKAGVW